MKRAKLRHAFKGLIRISSDAPARFYVCIRESVLVRFALCVGAGIAQCVTRAIAPKG